jgi:hypothetical protein
MHAHPRPGLAAICAEIRAGQLSQASRSARASLNTWATACSRSTSSPFESSQANLVGLRLDHLIDGAGLQQRGAAGTQVCRQYLKRYRQVIP